MGSPHLAQDFIEQVIKKHEVVYKNSEINEHWKKAKSRASEAFAKAVTNLANKLDSMPVSSEVMLPPVFPPAELPLGPPIDYDAAAVFEIGLYAEDYNNLQTLVELFPNQVQNTEGNNEGHKISSILQALHSNFNENELNPANSAAAKFDDWEQLVFPTQKASHNADSAFNCTVKNEVSFQEVIAKYDTSYPDKAYHFALNFFGVVPDNDKCDQFFTGPNIHRITRITDSLRIMGRPDLAKDFIAHIMAKHKVLCLNPPEYEEWKKARFDAEMDPLNSLVAFSRQPDSTGNEDEHVESIPTSITQGTDKMVPTKTPPNNSDPALGFRDGVHLEELGKNHQTLEILKEANLFPKRQKNGCYKISHLLQALNKDLNIYVLCPEYSAAGKGHDWAELVFPTQERSNSTNSPYSCNFIVGNEASFQESIKNMDSSYPNKAYNFALRFFGIDPQNDRSKDFFTNRNVRMITRITDSLRIMGKPNLAVSFVNKAMAKHESIYGNVENEFWTAAKNRASLACGNGLASKPTRQENTRRQKANNRKRLQFFRLKKAPR